MKIVQQLGGLRMGLVIVSLLFLAMRPVSGGSPVLEGWPLVTTLLVPALAPLVFLGLLMDMFMTWVMSIDTESSQRLRARSVLWVDLVLASAFALAWVPYYLSLGN